METSNRLLKKFNLRGRVIEKTHAAVRQPRKENKRKLLCQRILQPPNCKKHNRLALAEALDSQDERFTSRPSPPLIRLTSKTSKTLKSADPLTIAF